MLIKEEEKEERKIDGETRKKERERERWTRRNSIKATRVYYAGAYTCLELKKGLLVLSLSLSLSLFTTKVTSYTARI